VARQQYLPWAVAAAYAEWYATVGRNLFDDQEEAFEWWAATPEYIRHLRRVDGFVTNRLIARL